MSKNFRAELMIDTGHAITGIAMLIAENEERDQDDGGKFLNPYTLSGLAAAMKLLGYQLAGVGERFREQSEGKQ